MQKTKILIVDDHQIVIEGIKGALKDYPKFGVIGEALDGVQALKQVRSLRPDIVIMDIAMPHMNGIEATCRIKRLVPDVHVIIFTMHSNREYIIRMFKIGVSGYVLKEGPLSELILAIDAARDGGTYFDTRTSMILSEYLKDMEGAKSNEGGFESLSMREREVLRYLADGKTIKETAKQLYVSPKTVESHKYHIMAKLGIHSLADLTKIAIRKGLIKL